ncbi:hypothetical protein Ddye_026038 [Dipteronia dyeriana]|uniref:Endonuclease/exonuclease/phosphatase domain-containing protein n=1 Tax=Dipteronia dyeriana TaxID=168575 RepID=A0AAD9TM87_9ROSI|nr:hypothetical protein Ddye_026038 [Dipteronia dyeriana]
MNTFVWNTRGLGSVRAFQVLRNHMQNYSSGIVFLMETKVNHIRMENICVNLGFEGKLVVDCEGRSGGLGLFWSKKRFTGFYGHPEQNQRSHAWILLKWLHDMYKLPWLCAGDFNEIIYDDEKLGGPPRNRRMMENFREALEYYCGLEDMGLKEPIFTWSNKRIGDEFVQERLDRGFCNFEWKQVFPGAVVKHLELWHSDHRALLFDLTSQVDGLRSKGCGRRKRFHFEACWAEKEECHKLIKRSWVASIGSDELSSTVSNSYNCVKVLNDWNRISRRNMVRDICIKQNELRVASSTIIDGSWNHIRILEMRRNLLEATDAYGVIERKDRNTKFFHQKASARKACNRIQGIFYRDELFRSNQVSKDVMNQVIDKVQPRLSPCKVDNLDHLFTTEEVRIATFSTSPTKSPRPDGMPGLFYQKFWDIVDSNVTATCLWCLNDGNLMEEINGTLIVLIPKIKNSELIKDFWSISLCNVIYKIVAQALVNRLRLVLDEVISESQSAFIPGRLIYDNALIGFECLHVI